MIFHALTFAGSRGKCLNTRPLGQVLKHPPRDPASVKALKQACVIIILAYFNLLTKICTENAVKTLKYPFSDTEFL